MNIKLDSITVLKQIYHASNLKQTYETNLSYYYLSKRIHRLDIDSIKYCIEHLNDRKFVTFKEHAVFNEICLTDAGINFCNQNFK